MMAVPASGETPMNEVVSTPKPSGLGVRILHMLLFAVVFWVVCWAVALTAIVQLAMRVFSQTPNEELRRFGDGLATYAAQVIRFLCGVTDALPFPFTDWPNVPTRVRDEDISGL
jgi:uncharacterized RDD family membrane protein YckC